MSPKKTTENKKKTSIKNIDIPQSARIFWEQLTWNDITDNFNDTTAQRGKQYADSGHVQSLWVTKDGKNLLGIVAGHDDYKTAVAYENIEQKNLPAFFSSCSCPVGSDCKHGVALIVEFLDRLAHNKSVAQCRKLKNRDWEITSKTNKKSKLKLDFNFDFVDIEDAENENDDEDNGDDLKHEDLKSPITSQPSHLPTQSTTNEQVSNVTNVAGKFKLLLEGKPREELIERILELAKKHPSVKKFFEKDTIDSKAKSGIANKLVRRVIELINDEFKKDNGHNYYYYDSYNFEPPFDFEQAIKVIRRFQNFDDPMKELDRISRHLIKKSDRFMENSGAEDVSCIEGVFNAIVDVLLASKTDSVQLILWAYDMSFAGEYTIIGNCTDRICRHTWQPEVWSGAADALLAKREKQPEKYINRSNLRNTMEALDKANRQDEATNLLRSDAPKIGCCSELVDRLIEVNALDEAEKIIAEQLHDESKENRNYTHNSISSYHHKRKKIAELRNDWQMLASIQASEFFYQPNLEELKQFLKTASLLKIEPVIRIAIQKYLQTGNLPPAFASALEGKKPNPKDIKEWSIPFYDIQCNPEISKPQFELLCKWAIDETRPDDAIRWYDELLKQKPHDNSNQNLNQNLYRDRFDHVKVADAVLDSHPARAYQIYRAAAENEMEITRNYSTAVKLLRKARVALEKSNQSNEWAKLLAEVRTTHRRKINLMKLLNELEAGSIVKQKRTELKR